MGIKWNNAPIFYTVAQIRFNPVLSLKSYVDQIQERFRKSGYPDFRKREGFRLSLDQLVGKAPTNLPPRFEPTEQYSFDNQQRNAGFVLDQSMLSFQTTSYETSDYFLSQVISGLTTVNELVQLDFFERVGVRYLDAVTPEREEQISQYVVPEVLGIAGLVEGANIEHSFSETVIQLANNCRVTSRTVIQNGRIQFPPDLHVLELKLPARVVDHENIYALIDTDAVYELREDFDVTALRAHLERLRDGARRAFKATYTDYAETKWSRA